MGCESFRIVIMSLILLGLYPDSPATGERMKPMRFGNFAKPFLIALSAIPVFAVAALAGVPKPWQTGLQPSATPVMTDITAFHDLLLVIITTIVIFVTCLLLYIMWRFSASRNPQPSRNTHNSLLEVLWTVIPVVILVTIAVPSFKLLYKQDTIPKADMTIKAIGHQWYWSYEYPDNGKFTFDAQMVPDDEIKKGQHRLLETDNAIVLPVNTTIRVIVTADSVIHAWAVPAFGTKIDAVPGRLNETWIKVERKGTFYGQCSELCGVNHAFMPIKVRVVSKSAFRSWAARAKKKFAAIESPDAEQPASVLAQAPAQTQ